MSEEDGGMVLGGWHEIARAIEHEAVRSKEHEAAEAVVLACAAKILRRRGDVESAKQEAAWRARVEAKRRPGG